MNVLVDSSQNEGAPVVFEEHPHYHNLMGRIDYASSLGSLVTNFSLIKAGALHKANGGYLVLQARDVLLQPYVKELFIEQKLALVRTSTIGLTISVLPLAFFQIRLGSVKASPAIRRGLHRVAGRRAFADQHHDAKAGTHPAGRQSRSAG